MRREAHELDHGTFGVGYEDGGALMLPGKPATHETVATKRRWQVDHATFGQEEPVQHQSASDMSRKRVAKSSFESNAIGESSLLEIDEF